MAVTLTEVDLLSKALSPIVAEIVQTATTAVEQRWQAKVAALEMRILELETRPLMTGPAGPPGPQGEKGANGEKGDPGATGAAGLDGNPGAIGAKGDTGADGRPGDTGPKGEDGTDGRDGRDGKDAKDGRDGVNGKDGANGADGRDIDMEHVKALILGELATLPRPKDGRDGIDGKDGANGLDGKDGADGLHGKDGAPGTNGRDGVDGLAFEKADVVFDDSSGWTFRIEGGNNVKAIPFPFLYDAGVFEPGKTYPQGAEVTWDGHQFVAKTKTCNVPSEGSDWRLVVRRGRQGKEGKPGPPGRQGDPGKDGPQGPQGPRGTPVGV